MKHVKHVSGTVVTFYSYKGGVGRTFALANTAALLTSWGYRTLCIDWDIDAPGIPFYFSRRLSPPRTGLVDFINDFAQGRDPHVGDYVSRIFLPGRDIPLDLLPAGSSDPSYVPQAQKIDWADLYDKKDLGAFLEDCRERWLEDYDFVLVDSRTGITDISGICTAQLPDILVVLFTANEQSLRGVVDVVRRAERARDDLPYDRSLLMTLPVPARFDSREEYRRAQYWQERFSKELAPLFRNWAVEGVSIERLLGFLTIPYVSYWSFGEDLPALEEEDPTPEKIGYSLETLAATIAHRLDRSELLVESRDSFVDAATRLGLRSRNDDGYEIDVFISSSRKDDRLATSLEDLLARRSLRVAGPSRLRQLGVGISTDWQREMDTLLARSRHLVALFDGPYLDRAQSYEIDRFIRQTLDDRSNRMVLPVLTSDAEPDHLPSLLASRQYLRITGEEDLSDVADGIVDTITRGARGTSGRG
ncbi:putative ATP/GTP-binding protein [Candidatus Protofrankia californiensis]|uniref:Putative ATP/GTP-binding protein n=1 Tax=Candidatus Protofrankia californiensis TaxID=1839754 RepID=A0A1C3NWR3_9ACTN|nr:putative ATP/GTP-binding protein [Candidatus Protofrankia californiensis]